jgi:hypothetical protein
VEMVRVTKVDQQDAPSWEVAKTRLLALRDGESVSFAVDDDTWLIVLYIDAFGYLVTGCGQGELDYYTLVEPALGDEPVTAFDGGNTNIYPRYVFVSSPLLLKAVQTYYLTGTRDTSCDWIPDRDCVYE